RNLAGVIKLEFDPTRFIADRSKSSPISLIGNQAGLIGVGGSTLWQTIDSETVARIEDGARVSTGTGAGAGLNVSATENVSSVNLSQAGGASGLFGLSGSVSLAEQTSTTHAELGGAAQVTGGPVNVDSSSDVSYYNVAGGSQIAGMFGVGASAAVNRVTRDTAALVGTALGGTPVGVGGAGTVIDV